jgi:hypothetical protein
MENFWFLAKVDPISISESPLAAVELKKDERKLFIYGHGRIWIMMKVGCGDSSEGEQQ